jgi:dihydroorotate dehydrogenase
MMSLLSAIAKPLLLSLDPETAHGATIAALRNLPVLAAGPDDPRLAVEAFGLTFPNPIGMAAGFDKGAEVPDTLLRLGFGFTEIGTVTPKAQPGNPKPRSFRLSQDEAIINRFGFNSEGHAAVRRRLVGRAGKAGVVGVNIGANKDAADRAADYVAGIEAFADVASYFTVNISSPNTPGLRDLQQTAALDDLLARVLEARDATTYRTTRKPVLLKIAPDLAMSDLDDVVAVARKRGVDGMIVSNTTISRPETLKDKAAAQETGGLSGGAALSAVDENAGGDLPARRGPVSARRRRRRRQRRDGLGQDRGRRDAGATLFVADLQGPRPGRRHQDRHAEAPRSERQGAVVGRRRLEGRRPGLTQVKFTPRARRL